MVLITLNALGAGLDSAHANCKSILPLQETRLRFDFSLASLRWQKRRLFCHICKPLENCAIAGVTVTRRKLQQNR